MDIKTKQKKKKKKKGCVEEDKRAKSLRYSILDGTFSSMMVGFGESFFSAFAVFLKASNIQLGLLGSLPQALGSLLQLLSNKLIKLFNSRKRLICISVLLEALMYIPIALVFFFRTFRVYHLILFVCIYWIFGTIYSSAWNSWMGDLVNVDERGSYFGKRNKISGLGLFFSFLLGGFILQRFSDGDIKQYIGFAIIFGLAFISRIISLIYLTKKHEPRYELIEKAQFSFIDFLKQARFRNYGLFVIYLCIMNFAVFLSGPFFTAYMFYDLHFTYLTFTIVSVTALIVKFLTMPVWGKLIDKYGTKRILSLSGYLMPFVPLLWVFSAEVWYLILIQVYSGFIWAGFEISSFNFIFDTTTKQKRMICVAYYNVLNGIGVFLGAMIGSIIVRYNQLFWSKYFLVFILSFVLRYISSIIFIPKLKEVRNVEKISSGRLLLKLITTMPTIGIMHNIIIFKKNRKIWIKQKKIKINLEKK